MSYPKVLTEHETLEAAIRGVSLSRFGDGELRLATGADCPSQRTVPPGLKDELHNILKHPRNNLLVCLPGPNPKSPKYKQWLTYAAPSYTRLFRQDITYGSAFITRPDSAPWIDVPEYWERCKALWAGKRVCLVRGDTKSLIPEMMPEAESVREVIIPMREAYAGIDKIEQEQIGVMGDDVVIMCGGVTATCLAWRLTMRNIHALDLGHLGMFMKYQGAYHLAIKDLISDKYLILNRRMHDSPKGFGGSGHKQAEAVLDFVSKIGATSLIDYGCGEATLQPRLRALGYQGKVDEYDPAVKGKDKLPRPAHVVVCTDVLEHVELAKLDNVLQHIRALSKKGAYLVAATRPANKVMSNGENAHLIVQSPDWWFKQIMSKGHWNLIQRQDTEKGGGMYHDVRLWLEVK